jgi:threonine dehydratase
MLTFQEIVKARERIAPFVRKTPLLRSNHLSERLNLELFLKLESLQDTGSFKVRGALNRMLGLTREERERGVVAASAGNHAQGVAWAARRLGLQATVFMPMQAPIAKLLATKGYGARVIQHGETYDECALEARRWAQLHGAFWIPGFDDPDVVAGQGTAGIEICEDLKEMEAVLVPAGGGGLLAGVALAVKSILPRVEVWGVQSESAPALARSFEAGSRLSVPSGKTLADGIAVATPGEIPLEIIKKFVDRVLTVRESFIESAVVTFLERKHLVVEGAGAAGLALLLQEEELLRGRKVVLVVSGGNLDLQWLDRLIQRGAMSLGRRMRLRIVLPDVPGSLARVTQTVAKTGANILQVFHDRLSPEQPLHLSRVEFDLETRGPEHIQEIEKLLRQEGVEILQ